MIGGAFIGLPSAVSRFMLAPAAVLSLVGGVGLAEAVRTFRPGRPRLAAAGVLAVATLAFAVPRLAAVADQAQPRWGNRDDRRKVITVLQRADAKARFARCHGEIAVVKWSPFQVAWRLRVSVSTVRVWKPGEPPLRRGLLFLKSAKDFPYESAKFADVIARGAVARRVATADRLSVYEVGCGPDRRRT